MNIWNIKKVREENLLAGLLNMYERKDFENFVTDFTPGFFEGRGKTRGGGYLVYFADGMCTSFRVSFSAIYSKAGYLFC